MHIGVFDSGVGGMTVLAAVRDAFPSHEYSYLGDTARVPYGGKSIEVLSRYGIELLNFMQGRNVDAVVVACNTLSATVLPLLQRHARIPVYGVIDPAVTQALTLSKGAIGIIGTRATIASHAFARGIHAADPSRSVVEIACPLFVPLVEEGWVLSPVTKGIADTYLAPLKGAQIDTLILGCTHYPLLREVITESIGTDVHLVSSGPALVEMLQRDPTWNPSKEKWDGSSMPRRSQIHWFATDATESFGKMAETLGFNAPTVEIISID